MADTVHAPPGFAYSASYYCWSDGAGSITANWVQDPPVPWIDEVTLPLGQTSSACDDLFVINYRVHAPLMTGVYEAQFVDLNGLWDPWTVRLKVADVPTHIDGVFMDTLLVGQPHQFTFLANGSAGVADVGCAVQPYYPATPLVYEFGFHPAATWITVTPDSLPVQAGTDEPVVYDLYSALPGNFTTYLYTAGWWFGWPLIYRIDMEFVVSTDLSSAVVEAPFVRIHPNPASDAVVVRLEGGASSNTTLSLTDALGREVLRAPMNGSSHTLDLRDQCEGLYLLTLRSGQGAFSQRLIVD